MAVRVIAQIGKLLSRLNSKSTVGMPALTFWQSLGFRMTRYHQQARCGILDLSADNADKGFLSTRHGLPKAAVEFFV